MRATISIYERDIVVPVGDSTVVISKPLSMSKQDVQVTVITEGGRGRQTTTIDGKMFQQAITAIETSYDTGKAYERGETMWREKQNGNQH